MNPISSTSPSHNQNSLNVVNKTQVSNVSSNMNKGTPINKKKAEF